MSQQCMVCIVNSNKLLTLSLLARNMYLGDIFDVITLSSINMHETYFIFNHLLVSNLIINILYFVFIT